MLLLTGSRGLRKSENCVSDYRDDPCSQATYGQIVPENRASECLAIPRHFFSTNMKESKLVDSNGNNNSGSAPSEKRSGLQITRQSMYES